MKLKSFDHMNCSLAQTLNVIGERRTCLIFRGFFGKRFKEFRRSIARIPRRAQTGSSEAFFRNGR
jgi:DNA-binding HxlR family transcriptional regulator